MAAWKQATLLSLTDSYVAWSITRPSIPSSSVSPGMLVAQAMRYRWNRRMRSGEGFVPGSLIWIPVAGAALGKLAVALATTRVLMSVML